MVALVACTHDVEPEQQPPPMPEPEAPLPEARVIATGLAPIDLGIDDEYVYWLDAWTELVGNSSELRGHVVQWSKLTGQVTVLASIANALPADIAVADEHVYWTELHGWRSNGRDLGRDRLVRVAKTGGPSQIVAVDQYFDYTTPRPNVVAALDHVYWSSAGTFSEPSGTLARVRDADALAIVEPIGGKLLEPRGIATDGTHICFRTGHPNQTSAISCASVTGGPLMSLEGGHFPYAMMFFEDHLYWSDRLIERARVDQNADVESVQPAHRPIHLTANDGAIFWSQSPEGFEKSIRMREGSAVRTLWESDNTTRALAADDAHLYFIEHAESAVRRVPLD